VRQHAQIAGDVVADSLPRPTAPQQRFHPRGAWNSPLAQRVATHASNPPRTSFAPT
jgi:hypothetical protein